MEHAERAAATGPVTTAANNTVGTVFAAAAIYIYYATLSSQTAAPLPPSAAVPVAHRCTCVVRARVYGLCYMPTEGKVQ